MTATFTLLLGFFVGIIIILTLITIHEFGHFIVAKLAGAFVYEFSIGFGPKLFTFKGKETWLTFRLLPLGGYCSIASDKVDPPAARADLEIPDERKLDYIKRWKKLLFIIFGPLMNLFVALTIFTLTFAITQSKPNDQNWIGANYSQDKIAWKLLDESTAKPDANQVYVIWGWQLSNGSEIVFDNISERDDWNELSQKYKINEVGATRSANFLRTATSFNASIADLRQQFAETDVKLNLAFAYKIVNKFSGTTQESDVTWTRHSSVDEYSLGDLVGLAAPTRYFKDSTVAYAYGWSETFNQSISIIKSFGMIFTGRFSSLAGPVGIAGQTAAMFGSAQQFFLYVGMLSANLFILNMVFIPPLDGYKTLEIILEMILRKELPEKYKITVYVIGAIMFLLLFATITVVDFMR
ncbi:inner membrane zinc metalloprotease [Spiroplasma clarkii]|uniref:Inner membrane zinc metalloprotease n=1 Tax=Spiroplasma clarkii TaxID=2139 RepID=A0A1Y0L130_9MOLU|nr:site-2 protease family protein [Spiroplasma clarkii]ARU91445.1 inner membrane zinc metalloprotease [Spiroplasma clarkii]ATX70865.1 inner membrane zinc metalloprotease [Spiroplasma clarkii]